MPDVRILTWDWKEQPDLDELGRALTDLSDGRLHLAKVDTGSDQYAIALSAVRLDEHAVTEAYERWCAGG